MKFGTKMIKIYIERFRVSRKRKAIVAGKDDPRRENEMAAVPISSNYGKREERDSIPPRKPPRFVHCVDIQPLFFLFSFLSLSPFLFNDKIRCYPATGRRYN